MFFGFYWHFDGFSFFLKKICLLKTKQMYFFAEISISTVAQLVERLTLDLVDPVQMGSQDDFFSSFLSFFSYLLPFSGQIMQQFYISLLFEPKIQLKTTFFVLLSLSLSQFVSVRFIRLKSSNQLMLHLIWYSIWHYKVVLGFSSLNSTRATHCVLWRWGVTGDIVMCQKL